VAGEQSFERQLYLDSGLSPTGRVRPKAVIRWAACNRENRLSF
jgi:hypothetical protein